MAEPDEMMVIRRSEYEELLRGRAAALTEYGFQMSGGGWQTMNTEDYVLDIYPLAKQIAARQRFGGGVYRRRVVVVEDWKRLRKGAKS